MLFDFACYKPDDARKCSCACFMACTEKLGTFMEDNVEFQRRIVERSGLGEDTCLLEVVLNLPPNPSMANASPLQVPAIAHCAHGQGRQRQEDSSRYAH
ncbi:hypothetical protein ZWY2020_025218 [Hordeum vulgare]|nr:hypothetical protein ZWY2020_025218 [Hordeum vulgare]